MTYSIIGRDPAAGEIGIAVQSRWFHAGQDVITQMRLAEGS